MSRAGEFDWIDRYLAPLAGETAFKLRDDAATVPLQPDHELVVNQDAICENIHFLSGDPLDTVAQKALRVNLSDIVAKGADPFAYTMALGVPDEWQDADMALFCKGLGDDQNTYGIQLLGGDTYRSPQLTVSITMFGRVPVSAYVSRMGAKPGDLLLVSGTIGDAAIGLDVVTQKRQVDPQDQEFFTDAFRLPDPPVALAEPIRNLASASMDISDGLLGDCAKLCNASKLSAVIDRSTIPLSPQAQRQVALDPTVWARVLSGGDDYQCLFTIRPENWQKFQSITQTQETKVSKIGKISLKDDQSVSLHDDGVPLSSNLGSFAHF